MFTPNMAKIRQSLTDTQKAVRRAANDVKSLGNTATNIGRAMLPAAGAITGGVVYAAKQYADFSYSIERTAHIAGASAGELERLKQTAISVGSELPMTINETAQAMMKLASGGFDTNMIIGSFRSIAMAAEASGADITLVSDTISNALSVWDLKNTGIEYSSARVADAIQAATNKSKLSFDKFAVAMQGGGNIAGTFGESIERVTALMGTLADNGIQASNIGTTLKNAYTRLAANTSSGKGKPGAADILKEQFGVNVFDDKGNIRSMIDIVNELHTAIKGLSDKDIAPALKQVFGMYALPGMQKLLRSDAAIQKMNDLVKNIEDASSPIVRLQQNVSHAADKLKALGVESRLSKDKMRPMISIVKDLHEKLKGMNEEQAKGHIKDIFGSKAAENKQFVKAMVSVDTTDFGELVDILRSIKGRSEEAFDAMQKTFGGKVKLMMSTLDALVHKIGDALEPLLTPIIDGITSILKKFQQMDKETLTTILKIAMGFVTLTAAVLTVGAALTIFGKVTAFLIPIGAQLAAGATLSSLFAARIASIGLAFNAVRGIALLVLNALISPIKSLGLLLVSPFAKLARSITIMTTMMSYGTSFTVAFRTALQSLALSMGWVSASGVTIFSRLGTAITAGLAAAYGALARFVAAVFLAPITIVAAVGRIIAAIRMIGSLQGLFTLIAYGIRAVSLALVASPIGVTLLAIAAIVLFVAANWQTFKEVAQTVWNKIKFVVEDVVNSLKGTFKDFSTSVGKDFDSIITSWNKLTGSTATSGGVIYTIIHSLGSLITATVIIIATAIEGVLKAIMIVIQTIIGVLAGIIKFITGVFTGNWSMAWEGIKQVFISIFGGIGKFFLNIVETISNGIDRLMGKSTEAAQKYKEFEKAEQAKRENWLSGNSGDQALAMHQNQRRSGTNSEYTGAAPTKTQNQSIDIDTSKAQSGLDNMGEAAKNTADAVNNNARATEQFNLNLDGTGQSIEKIQQDLDKMIQASSQNSERLQQSMQNAENNFTDFNTNIDFSKLALQQHSEMSNASKDAIQQLGDTANTSKDYIQQLADIANAAKDFIQQLGDTANSAKDFIQQLGETANGAFGYIQQLGNSALTAAGHFDNLGLAVSGVVSALLAKAGEISNIHITVPQVTTVPVAAPAASGGDSTGKNYIGTNFWRGGLTWVHEQGPELIDLPSGTRIIPHAKSLQEEYQRGYENAMLKNSSDVKPMNIISQNNHNNSEIDNKQHNRSNNENYNTNTNVSNNSNSTFNTNYEASHQKHTQSNFNDISISNKNSKFTTGNVSNTKNYNSPQMTNIENINDIEEINSHNDSPSNLSTSSTGQAQSNHLPYESSGNPQSNLASESVSNAQSNIHSNNQGQNVYAPNMNFTITKLADTVIVREEADIERLANRALNKMVFWFQAHAHNRVVGAVR